MIRETLLLNKKKKILLIDDEAEIVSSVSEMLVESGYEVTGATSGSEGLKKAIQDHPDLIFLDIIMPKMDGYEVLRKLKRDADVWDIPVIMVTAKGETASILQTLDLNATDYIIKPFNINDLLRAIDRYA